MKRITLTLALILTTIMSFAQTKDSEGHVLSGLWKEYYKARKADKPKDQCTALEAIKKEAAEKRLAWDFYDAADKYVSVRSEINWKDRQSLQEAFQKEVEQMGEPVAVFFMLHYGWSKEACEKYVTMHKDELLKSSNPEFYKRDGKFTRFGFYQVLSKLVKNDYEYAIWSILGANQTRLVADYYGDTYPQAALAEYWGYVSTGYEYGIYDKLGAYANKYAGKAAALLAIDWRLSYDWRALDRNKTSTSRDFEDMRDRCKAFIKDRSSFTGLEKQIADCCTRVDGVLNTLESKNIETDIDSDRAQLGLRNIKSLDFSILSGDKKVWSTQLVNQKASYYKVDTLSVNLPDLPDGKYEVLCTAPGCVEKTGYSKHSLSMAVRRIDKGYGAFVAEYISGKPVQKCIFEVLDADDNVILTTPELDMEGFTQLPDDVQKQLRRDDERKLRARCTDSKGLKRMSESLYIYSYNWTASPEDNKSIGNILVLTDRGAYNPGETIHFKAILYQGRYSYELVPAGTSVTVELIDPENNTVATQNLTTNDFGSVSGSFPLTGTSRGGMFRLRVMKGSTASATRSVRVDEFVLPTFELEWDRDDMLYLRGDEVRVSGRVVSYSGHKLGEVRARYSIPGHKDIPVELRPDGTFEFFIDSEKVYDRYGFPVTVTVADSTGETLDFQTYKHVNYRIPLSATVKNEVPGRYTLSSGSNGGGWIIRDSFARVLFSTGGYLRKGMEIYYEVQNESGKKVLSGTADPGATLDLDLSGKTSGLYKLIVKTSARRVDGEMETADASYTFIKAEDTDTALDMNVTSFFKELGGEDIALQFGSTDGPVWAVVELVCSGNVLLEHQMITLKGERGRKGSLVTVSYPRKEHYPESLTLSVLYFHKGMVHTYSRTIELPVITRQLPLSFTRFTDLVRPGQKCSLLIATEPGVECAATLFDKATEEIEPNAWRKVLPARRPVPVVRYRSVCGSCGMYYLYDDMVYGADAAGAMLMKTASRSHVMAEAADMEEASEPNSAGNSAPDVHIRDNFGATMAWESHLRSDDNGQIELGFTGADRLSTYYVQLFAHDKDMTNAVLRQELKVSIPVKLSFVQPLFLYAGDEYVARATVSSTQDVAVSGKAEVRIFGGSDYKTAPQLLCKSQTLTIPAGGSVPFSAAFDIPADEPVLGVLVTFTCDDKTLGSDAMFVSIPVKGAVQTLTEAHSAVFLAGADKDKLIADLRSRFVNADASSIVPVERDILAMIREAIPDSIEPKGSDVLSLTEAYYSNVLARRVGAPGVPEAELAEIMKKIASCQNTGGGIAWFEGMRSSPVITAAVLQRIASMPEAESSPLNVEAAVKYLDSSYFTQEDRPWWCGTLSMENYLLTRSLYPGVSFEKPASKQYRQFKKSVRSYLTPSVSRGLNANILGKARRLRTLQSLLTLDEGKTLAKAWGLNLCRRVSRSYLADVESLLQYSVSHKSGGCYYPNAVMPWRGLLESELYAHALLCDLFTAASSSLDVKGDSRKSASAASCREVAEGIRLWIMIQKETQQWEKDAAYIEAIASVLRGTPETLQTKVIVLSTTFTKPFASVKASGNGFTVERKFSLNGKELSEGDKVRVGDRILASYKIWSEENRSFVRLTAPRPASMRPVNQLSGHIGWMFRPMSYGAWSFSPQGYRNVLSDKTEYWFDSYPEEHTTLTEEFFVTQEGSFQMPAVEIESLYAPHYRANDSGRGALVSE